MDKNMPRVLGYIRVSTEEQAKDDRLSVDQQRTAIRNGCALYHLDLVGIYEDLGVSSGVAMVRRPGARAMMRRMSEEGGFDGLVVFDITRLGRSITDNPYIVRELFAHKLKLWSIMDRGPNPYDGDNPGDVSMLDFQALSGEMFLSSLRKRITTAVAHAKRTRRVHNHPPLTCRVEESTDPSGLTRKVFVDDAHMLACARLVRQWRSEGATWTACARRLTEEGMHPRGDASVRWRAEAMPRLARQADGFYAAPTQPRRARSAKVFADVLEPKGPAPVSEEPTRRLTDEQAVRAWVAHQGGARILDAFAANGGFGAESYYRRWRKLGLKLRGGKGVPRRRQGSPGTGAQAPTDLATG